MSKKTLWIFATIIFSAIAGIYFYLNINNKNGTTIVTVLAAIALYFLFQTGQLYQKMWTKILIYLLDVIWIIIVILIVSLIIR